MGINVYKNMLWDILDEGSKLYILDMLMKQEFQGDCKMISKINGDTTILEIKDNFDHELVLPIDILSILNN
jgi:hypothetical protein